MLTLPLIIEEYGGIGRVKEPVTVGVPLPEGTVQDLKRLRLFDDEGRQVPLQVAALARWKDGSVRWALLDFLASVGAEAIAEYRLACADEGMGGLPVIPVAVRHTPESVDVDVGLGVFVINRGTLKPFDRVVIEGTEVLAESGSGITFTDQHGHELHGDVRSLSIVAAGPVRATVKLEGEFCAKSGPIARYVCRMSFYAGSALAEVKFTIHNPKAAHHPGGLWDLGDEGSIFFKDLSLHVPLMGDGPTRSFWTTQPSKPFKEAQGRQLEIFQASSGGVNWNSRNHVNRSGEVKLAFPGYRVITDGVVIEEGKRATPLVAMEAGPHALTGAIQGFWENFPKSLCIQNGCLSLRFFPLQPDELYELQGGEQKTHTAFLEFGPATDAGRRLAWTAHRLVPRATPEWYADSKAVHYITPRKPGEQSELVRIIDTAVEGDNSFFARREIIDEYGWRNFGELFADHEIELPSGRWPLISHYNNQYDVIFGSLIQYLATADRRWFRLSAELAQHVIDIDMYRTQEDSRAYDGGLFWHTDHHVDAGTATHRAYSKVNAARSGANAYGGGPSNEHNYTTGLLYYYFLTGDEEARHAVLGLGDWVINMDDGSSRPLGWLDRRPTGLASSTAERGYHGPGRGAGNSVNSCLDAHALGEADKYLLKAEELVRRCIHPDDDVAARGFGNVEDRWSYTVFLQALGKYLHVKEETGQIDYMYGYAQASLLQYAKWMVEHEVPYKQVLDRVKIPSATWAAQDIRKSIVFNLAARHADEPLRTVLRRKADYFFESCLKDLVSFDTWWVTRPVAILMGNGFVQSYFEKFPEEKGLRVDHGFDYGLPTRFRPHLSWLYALREWALMFRGGRS